MRVDAGHRGVVLRFGAVQPNVLGEGLHFIMPFIEQVVKMDVRMQKYTAAEVDSASKDLQQIFTTVALNCHIDPGMANRVYQTIGLEFEQKITFPAVEETVKESTAKFTAEQLITERRAVKTMITDGLRERLAAYNIVLEVVSIENFRFSSTYMAAVEAKVTAEQRALEELNRLQQVKYQAQQKVAEAEGIANSTIAQAKGEAEARLAKAAAEAEAIRLITQQLTPDYLQLKAMETWDGRLPTVMFGAEGGAVPFIQIPIED